MLDVKPANVLLTRHGQAVLTDFGLTRQMEDGKTHAVGGGKQHPQEEEEEESAGG
jgi:serine/threonine protein kinase